MSKPVFEEGKKPITKQPQNEPPQPQKDTAVNPITNLQQQVGNRAVQRLIQRGGGGPTELDDDTAGRIESARGSGQSLDPGIQEKMGTELGYDFSGVKIHTDKESEALNQSISAEAFTTGKDIFFNESKYNPQSSQGQELLAHELTHVVQQGTGKAGGSGSGMTVNEPGDAHEQEADSMAKAVTGATAETVHRQEEEEEMIQPRRLAGDLQRQEEEEYAQMQEEEEEEMLQPKLEGDVHRASDEELEEEDVMAKHKVQRQEELPEEEL